MGNIIPYPALEHHTVIGDRRTAALVSADGTIDWLCLPDYDGTIVFGALLDAERGGHWRLGPSKLWTGEQSYDGSTAISVTRWSAADCELELVDAMALPGDDRPEAARDDRIVLRWLHCTRGAVECVASYAPAADFEPASSSGTSVTGLGCLDLWSNRPQVLDGRTFHLATGESVWMVLSRGTARSWSVESAEGMLEEVRAFWFAVGGRLGAATHEPRRVRAALTIRLLEFAPSGSSVASPTTSLPERIGGGWNADYRFTWVRDASLAMEALARLGDLESAERYLDWLSRIASAEGSPLQVLYTVHGGRSAEQRERSDIDGYRGSRPIRVGNHAYRQHQLDIFGYLADCAYVYLDRGGRWRRDLWDLLCRSADHVARHWTEAGNGMWELPTQRHYLSSRVMCWTALDRVLRIASRTGQHHPNEPDWRAAAARIRSEVEQRGWSDRLKAFRQAFDNDVLDASALLIPLTGFLELADPRVRATVERIVDHLTIDGCVYRFDPRRVPDIGTSAMGESECAFLPCTFWLASVFALSGRRRDAEHILSQVERVSGAVGLFAEAIDPRNRSFAGNMPLLFSHVEYLRAVDALDARTPPRLAVTQGHGPS